ncbi:MAG: response regulator [Provencibacterium sp.]|jgi:two-component system sensor histidine kinase/response regulator|nr:response regulator [Provencibacterium sp.]
MRNKTIRFLMVSLILLLLLCVTIFSFLATYMNETGMNTITEVGTIYMSGMSDQICRHFETTISLRLSQMEALIDTLSSGSADEETLREELRYNATARGFDALAFYSRDGQFDMIYGDPMSVTDPEPFLKTLNDGAVKIAVGSNTRGEKIVLLGISADYPMKNGAECTALVASLPIEYIRQTLSLDEPNALIYSHIIRWDGSFVIRSEEMEWSSYFDRIREIAEPLDGMQAETYVSELSAAIKSQEDYSTILQVDGERQHLYCTSLPYSEWYLVTILPYGALNEAVKNMSVRWVALAVGSCSVILLVLIAIFFKYFQMTRQQIKILEETQKEAIHANKAKSEFLSNMSHDIRTPMNAIVGMTAIATANIDNKQQVQNCLRKISLSSKHLLGLINDVLDMSKIESGKMTLSMDQVSLREVMDSIVSIVQPQVKVKQQTFDVFIHDITEEHVLCDSVRLNQVLLNFLSNAIKFTPEGGAIQVSLQEEASPKGEDFVRIHIHVKDSGIGMSQEFQEKIFESFSREDSSRVHKTEGTGLGMAITKYIIDAMGGSIFVHSEQGKGTEFHVVLDLERAEVAEVDMVLPDWNMLVVDDDQLLCETTASALASIGVKADWALDGETAVKMVTDRHRKRQDYHIILLDWKLPDMDGIRTARILREQLADNIPILLISAYDWSEIEEEARAAGVSGFISKPLFKSTLFYGLKQYAGEEKETEAQSSRQKIDFTGRHVLLAEDNDLNWEIAEELLSDLGLDLEWAEDGQICLEKFQRSPVGFYDAILMDLRMPRMTGYEATQAIRALDRSDAVHIPIIAMTADAFSEDVKRCLDCGMNAHVSKPIDVNEIARLLEKFLAAHK